MHTITARGGAAGTEGGCVRGAVQFLLEIESSSWEGSTKDKVQPPLIYKVAAFLENAEHLLKPQ